MIVRKSVNDLTAAEQLAYVNGVKAMKSSGTYDTYTQIHNDAMMHSTSNGSNAAHMGPAFLPWHREFILRLEKGIQTALGNPQFGLPYWDWAADSALSNSTPGAVWSASFMGGQGNPVTTGPFAAGLWTLLGGGSLVRRFGLSGAATLPTPADVAAALTVTPYDSAPWNTLSDPSFRNKVEGWISGPQMHNRVHVWVGGSMLPMTSPDDPVFYLNHCNEDRIWAAWQFSHPGVYLPSAGGPSGHNLNDNMWPWNTSTDHRTPANELDYPSLGYVYDHTAVCSAQFPKSALRIDGTAVTQFMPSGGGVVNCQFGVAPWEKFRLVPQGNGSVAIGSIQFPGVFLRMDGSTVKQSMASGGGVVNCQHGVGPWEKFNLVPQGNGTVAIGSVQFPNVYLRMDGSQVTQQLGPGSGVVNCQFGIGAWEKFRLLPTT